MTMLLKIGKFEKHLQQKFKKKTYYLMKILL
jgi:hypothetical protein